MTRMALIGCGLWGRNIARALAELGVLRTICDADAQRAAAIATPLGAAHTTDVRQILESDDIDGVVIATPAVTHAGVALQTLGAGKHVFVEKPIALSLDDARAVADQAARSNRVLMVGHLLRYHPLFVELHRRIDEGELGAVRYIYSNRLNQGRIRTEENALWSLAPHDLSMILAIIGRRPRTVTAGGTAIVQPAIADLANLQLDFGDGLRAHAYCSWYSPYREHRFAVIGERAMAVFDDTTPDWDKKLTIYRHGVSWSAGIPEFVRGEAQLVTVPQSEPLRDEMAHFVACVEGKAKPRTGAAEAMEVLATLAAAQESLDRAGVPVVLDNTARSGAS